MAKNTSARVSFYHGVQKGDYQDIKWSTKPPQTTVTPQSLGIEDRIPKVVVPPTARRRSRQNTASISDRNATEKLEEGHHDDPLGLPLPSRSHPRTQYERTAQISNRDDSARSRGPKHLYPDENAPAWCGNVVGPIETAIPGPGASEPREDGTLQSQMDKKGRTLTDMAQWLGKEGARYIYGQLIEAFGTPSSDD